MPGEVKCAVFFRKQQWDERCVSVCVQGWPHSPSTRRFPHLDRVLWQTYCEKARSRERRKERNSELIFMPGNSRGGGGRPSNSAPFNYSRGKLLPFTQAAPIDVDSNDSFRRNYHIIFSFQGDSYGSNAIGHIPKPDAPTDSLNDRSLKLNVTNM